MDSNEDDDLEKKYLFLKKEMAELRQALRDKQAVNEQDRHWEGEVIVVSDEEEAEQKSLDVIGMRERGFDVKTLDKDESLKDVDTQTGFRCPQPNCVCLFKYPSDLVEHQNNVHPADEVYQFEASSQNSASFSQLQDNLRITYTDSDGQSVDEEVFEIVIMRSEDTQNYNIYEEEDVELKISELNKESKTVIEIEDVEEADKTEGAEETGELYDDNIEKPNRRNANRTSESKDSGDDVAMPEDNGNSGDEIDLDSATELEDNDQVDGRYQTVGRFRCQHPGCARSFKHKNSLKQHENIHTARFQCQVCQKCCKSVYDLEQHLSVHSDNRPFACDWVGCGSTFNLEYQLKRHRKAIHSDERPFKCNKQGCGKSFKFKEKLTNHLKYTHSSLRPFKCQVRRCDWRFKTKQEMKSHLNRVHSDVRNYRCHIKDCGKTFKSRSDLKSHMIVHSDEFTIKCTENGCDASFKTKRCFTRHLQTHSSDRPFQCQQKGCDKRFKRKDSLTEHVKSVHLRCN